MGDSWDVWFIKETPPDPLCHLPNLVLVTEEEWKRQIETARIEQAIRDDYWKRRGK